MFGQPVVDDAGDLREVLRLGLALHQRRHGQDLVRRHAQRFGGVEQPALLVLRGAAADQRGQDVRRLDADGSTFQVPGAIRPSSRRWSDPSASTALGRPLRHRQRRGAQARGGVADRRPRRTARSPSRSTHVAFEISVKMPSVTALVLTSRMSSSWRPSGITSLPTRFCRIGEAGDGVGRRESRCGPCRSRAGWPRSRSCPARRRRKPWPSPPHSGPAASGRSRSWSRPSCTWITTSLTPSPAIVVAALPNSAVPQLRAEEHRPDHDRDQHGQRETADDAAPARGCGLARIRSARVAVRRGGPTATGFGPFASPSRSAIADLSDVRSARRAAGPASSAGCRPPQPDRSSPVDLWRAPRPPAASAARSPWSAARRPAAPAPARSARPAARRASIASLRGRTRSRSARVRGRPTTTSTASMLVDQLRQPAQVLVRASIPAHGLHRRGQNAVGVTDRHPDANAAHVDTEAPPAPRVGDDRVPGPVRSSLPRAVSRFGPRS